MYNWHLLFFFLVRVRSSNIWQAIFREELAKALRIVAEENEAKEKAEEGEKARGLFFFCSTALFPVISNRPSRMEPPRKERAPQKTRAGWARKPRHRRKQRQKAKETNLMVKRKRRRRRARTSARSRLPPRPHLLVLQQRGDALVHLSQRYAP